MFKWIHCIFNKRTSLVKSINAAYPSSASRKLLCFFRKLCEVNFELGGNKFDNCNVSSFIQHFLKESACWQVITLEIEFLDQSVLTVLTYFHSCLILSELNNKQKWTNVPFKY